MAMQQFDNVLSAIATDEVTTLDQLYELQKKGAPSNVYLPFADNIYDIDIKSRTIHGPTFISVQREHKAEVIYFRIDRFCDYMDLANTACVVEYIVPGDEKRIPHLYAVPFYDVSKFMKDGKMIFPWTVGGAATSKDGTIEYAIRFFKIEENEKGKRLDYSLSTLPAKSKILRSLEADGEIMKAEYDIPVERYEELLYQLKNSQLCWTIV